MTRRALAQPRFTRRLVLLAPLVSSVLAFQGSVVGQTENRWIGPNNGEFATVTNWSTGKAPLTTERIVYDLPGSATVLYEAGSRDIDSLRVDNGVFALDLGDAATRFRTTNNSLGVSVGSVDHQSATLVIRNGGLIDQNDSGAARSIGSSAQAVGTVIVSLDGSWLHTGANTVGLLVGDEGQGTLVVERNGLATGQFLAVGNYGQGALTIKDDGVVRMDDDILVGRQVGGAGAVVVAGNGLLEQTTANSTLSIGGNASSAQGSGSVELRQAGVVKLAAGSSVDVWGGGELNLNGGVLVADKLNLRGGSFNWSAGRIQGVSGNMDLVTVGGDDLQRSTLSLHAGNDLTLDQTLTVSAFGTFELAGGKFSVASVANSGKFVYRAGELEVRSQALTLATGQLLGNALSLATGDRLAVTQGLTVAAGSRLTLSGGTVAGGTLANAGTISGSGRVENKLENGATGQVIVRSGDWLTFAAPADAAAHTNQGDLFLDNGTLQFDRTVSNAATGRILGRGELLLGQGLTSTGLLHFDAGVTDVHGNVELLAGARTIVSADGTATFFDDVKNNGDQFTVRAGAAAVFVGMLSGKGIDGPGAVVVDGTLSPGNSPGSMTFGGDLTLGSDSQTKLEIQGFTPGTQHDVVQVAGDLTAGGNLSVSMDSATQAALSTGRTFQLLQFASSTGDFATVEVPDLGGVLALSTANLLVNGQVQVISEVTGDADGNGRTDLSDFGVLKVNFGTSGANWSQGDFDLDGKISLSDFGLLKANFGASAPAAAVPEPQSLLLAALGGVLAWFAHRIRRSSN